jgi:hypothetical protein
MKNKEITDEIILDKGERICSFTIICKTDKFSGIALLPDISSGIIYSQTSFEEID